MLKKILLLSALSGMILASGCIKDDLDSCPPGVELSFEYVLNNEETDLFAAQVNKVTVYAFDQAGLYLGTFTESGSSLAQPGYKLTLPLEPGKYTLLTLGGPLTGYTIAPLAEGQTSIDDFLVLLNQVSPGVGTSPSELFYAKNTVDVLPQKKTQVKASLLKNTSRVVFRIREDGVENSPVEHQYELFLTGTNNQIDKDNDIPADAPELRYNSQPFTVSGNVYETHVDLMRLVLGNPVYISLMHPGFDGPILSADLLELLKARGYLTQIALDKEDLFIIEIIIPAPGPGPDPDPKLTVTVKVNGWTVIVVYAEKD